jgi:hypothetical protein
VIIGLEPCASWHMCHEQVGRNYRGHIEWNEGFAPLIPDATDPGPGPAPGEPE